jgi:aldose 1-epimerase
MIKLRHTLWENLTLYSFQLPDQTTIEFLPGYGAGLNGLHIPTSAGLVNFIEGYQEFTDIEKNGKVRYLSSFLFPFPNRTQDGKYSFEAKDYQFPINETARNNALHGMLHNKPFIVSGIFTDGEVGKIEMVYHEENPPHYYPFPFEVRIRWEFSVEGLSCHTSIENIGESKMPVGFGWHPYFKTGSRVNDWKVGLPNGKEFLVDERMIPTGEKVAFDKFSKPALFGETHFDTGFELPANSETVESSFEDPALGLKVNVWQETGPGKYNYLQVYSPPDRNMLAIEPMTCPANALQTGESLNLLPPGQIQQASFGIKWALI